MVPMKDKASSAKSKSKDKQEETDSAPISQASSQPHTPPLSGGKIHIRGK